MIQDIFVFFVLVGLSSLVGCFVFRSYVIYVFWKTKRNLLEKKNAIEAGEWDWMMNDSRKDLEIRVFEEGWIPFVGLMSEKYLRTSPLNVHSGIECVRKCKTLIRCAVLSAVVQSRSRLSLNLSDDVSL